tara:strand:- start:3150 stop:3572 length:423 start_codon:yes stop_codon:yes gene_type:complete
MIASSLALSVALTGAAAAEIFEVQQLNRGDAGMMVFEPGFLRIAVGDTVNFIATDRSHNAESIPEMMPEGAAEFSGKMNKDVAATFDVPGLYAIRCKPHYAMGMVMMIAVGDIAEVPAEFLEGRIPKNALTRFEDQLTGL